MLTRWPNTSAGLEPEPALVRSRLPTRPFHPARGAGLLMFPPGPHALGMHRPAIPGLPSPRVQPERALEPSAIPLPQTPGRNVLAPSPLPTRLSQYRRTHQDRAEVKRLSCPSTGARIKTRLGNLAVELN